MMFSHVNEYPFSFTSFEVLKRNMGDFLSNAQIYTYIRFIAEISGKLQATTSCFICLRLTCDVTTRRVNYGRRINYEECVK